MKDKFNFWHFSLVHESYIQIIEFHYFLNASALFPPEKKIEVGSRKACWKKAHIETTHEL